MEQGNLLDVIRTDAPAMRMYAPCCAGCQAWELTCLPQRMPPCYVALEEREREKKKPLHEQGHRGNNMHLNSEDSMPRKSEGCQPQTYGRVR